MASDWYDEGVDQFCRGKDGAGQFLTDTMKILLLKTAGFVTTHATVTAVLAGAAEEADATNYARGTLASKTSAETGGIVKYDAADQVFSSLGGTLDNNIKSAVIYREVTDDTDSVPIWYVDFSDLSTNGLDFTVAFAANGIGDVQ